MLVQISGPMQSTEGKPKAQLYLCLLCYVLVPEVGGPVKPMKCTKKNGGLDPEAIIKGRCIMLSAHVTHHEKPECYVMVR